MATLGLISGEAVSKGPALEDFAVVEGKMTESVANDLTPPTSSNPTPSSKRHPWDKRPEENVLWYARFLRFVALGPTRSVSLLATGRRNAYPVPAHWPIQAKQWEWRERAKAFDEAAKANPRVIQPFNTLLEITAAEAVDSHGDLRVEGPFLVAAVRMGGYHAPPPDEDDSKPVSIGT